MIRRQLKKRLDDIRYGTNRARFEVCYHDDDTYTPMCIRALQGFGALLKVDPRYLHFTLIPVNFTKETGHVGYASNRRMVYSQEHVVYKSDDKLRTSRRYIRLTVCPTRKIREHNSFHTITKKLDHDAIHVFALEQAQL